MKVVSTEALTKLIQLIKSSFISVDDTEQTSEIETETLNEITLATVATTGDYDDLLNKPTIPTVNDATLTITQGGTTKGTFTANASSDVTIDLDAGGSGYHPDLLTFQWSDHLLNNVSWLRADTFSWQDGTVYEAAYEHLTDDITGITPTTETIGSNTITVYVATDGHKIVLADQAQTVQDIYNETGVAWYFILDTTNQRFKLPRTKFGLTGLRDTVGKYVEAGLPNITGDFNTGDRRTHCFGSGAFYSSTTTNSDKYSTQASITNNECFGFDASLSNSIYGNSNTVQPPATQMYLYFYLGDYTQTAIEQTAGLNAELFNGKLDLDLGNITNASKETIVGWGMPDYSSGISLGVTTYTAPSNGFIFCNLEINEGVISLTINGQECATGGGNRSNNDKHLVPIASGQTAVISFANRIETFFPCIGG